jgi:hypothetical protein
MLMDQDSPRDSDALSQWLTITQLAELRQISRPSAARLVRRRGWRKQKDNHGSVRYFVPSGHEQPREDSPKGKPMDEAQALIAAKDEHIASLKDAVATLQARADRLQVELDAWRVAGWWRRWRLRRATGRLAPLGR